MQALRRVSVVALALVAAIAAPGLAATAARDPATLVQALVHTAIPASSPPVAGLGAPKILRIPLSDNSKAHHGVGTVELVFGNGDYATIVYDVFPTRKDAVADYRAAKGHAGDMSSTAPRKVMPATCRAPRRAPSRRRRRSSAVRCRSTAAPPGSAASSSSTARDRAGRDHLDGERSPWGHPGRGEAGAVRR